MADVMSFGQWVKLRRRALLLTQEALAREVYCSTELIRKIEADARRPSPAVAARMAEKLALQADDWPLFVQVARAAVRVERLPDPLQVGGASSPAPRRATATIPLPLTPLIGRAQELAAIRARLCQSDVRLVTLVGPPGIGKTRLALHTATTLHDSFRDGVGFVSLVNVRTPDLVIATIAATLGVRELAGRTLAQRLADVLRARELLLVLDNCEHVISAMPAVAELPALAPRLKILATSRAVLRLSGECEFPVPPLALPNLAQPHTLAALADYPAIELFVQRAVAVRPDFALNPANGHAVATICARLDGIPLAIELAAARSKLLSPPTLLERLTESHGAALQLLNIGVRDRPAHQQTLRGALDWSYQLLDQTEQTLLRRLGVFVGGCTLEGVAAITQEPAASTTLLDQIGALVDKSLVNRTERPDGEMRFTLLETIREYALEQLTAAGEVEMTRRSHALYYLALAERAEPVLEETAQGAWPERLNAEHGNLLEALTWLLSNEPRMAIRLASALWRFWMQIGYLSEGRRRLVQALESDAGAIIPARAKALRAGHAGLASRRLSTNTALWRAVSGCGAKTGRCADDHPRAQFAGHARDAPGRLRRRARLL